MPPLENSFRRNYVRLDDLKLIDTFRSIGRMDTVWQVCDPDYLGMCAYEIDKSVWIQVLNWKSRKMKLRFSQRSVRSLPSLEKGFCRNHIRLHDVNLIATSCSIGRMATGCWWPVLCLVVTPGCNLYLACLLDLIGDLESHVCIFVCDS